MTQIDLAAALGDPYTQSMVSQVETGRSSVRLEGLVNAAKELGVSTDFLLGLTDDPTPASLRAPAGANSELEQVNIEAAGPANRADSVPIRQLSLNLATNHENVSESELERLAFPQVILAENQIDPRQVRFIRTQGPFMFPAVPEGAVLLVDLARRWLMHNLIYLIIINAQTQAAAYEVRRIRAEGHHDFQWHTDLYLDRQDFGGLWPAKSWREDLWREKIWASVFNSQNSSTIDPIPHDNEVQVVGQVRGVFHMFDDQGW